MRSNKYFHPEKYSNSITILDRLVDTSPMSKTGNDWIKRIRGRLMESENYLAWEYKVKKS
jgi:hypothetical protein